MVELPNAAVILLLTLGALFSLLNWCSFVATAWTGKFHSAVPLVGGLCLGAGALLLPPLRPYAWAVVFLDYGTIVFVVVFPRLVREMWSTSWFNLMEEYVGVRGRTTVRVRLFRREVFIITWRVARPAGDYGLVEMSRVGTWEREPHRLIIRIGDDEAVLVPLLGVSGWRPSGWFDFCRSSEDLAGDGLELLRRVSGGREPDGG